MVLKKAFNNNLREMMGKYQIHAMAWAPFTEGRDGNFKKNGLAEIGNLY